MDEFGIVRWYGSLKAMLLSPRYPKLISINSHIKDISVAQFCLFLREKIVCTEEKKKQDSKTYNYNCTDFWEVGSASVENLIEHAISAWKLLKRWNTLWWLWPSNICAIDIEVTTSTYRCCLLLCWMLYAVCGVIEAKRWCDLGLGTVDCRMCVCFLFLCCFYHVHTYTRNENGTIIPTWHEKIHLNWMSIMKPEEYSAATCCQQIWDSTHTFPHNATWYFPAVTVPG